MPDEGFGSGLWKNIQAVQFGREGEMLAPVRADGPRAWWWGSPRARRGWRPRAPTVLTSRGRSGAWWHGSVADRSHASPGRLEP
jgi:hypothetical protein